LLAKAAAIAVAALLLSIYARQAVTFISNPGFVLGYTDFKNTSPDLVVALRAIDPQRTIITNDYELTYFLAGRAPLALPRATENFTRQANPEFDAQLQRVERLMKEGAVLVTINEESDPGVAEVTAGLVHWQEYGRAIFYVDPAYQEQP
jgi:hypothetical protein